MADRYNERTYATADTMDRDYRPSAKVESDPLAELARLIGQADPNADFGQERAAAPARSSRRQPSPPIESEYEAEDDRTAGPPPWMQRHGEPRQPSEPAVPRDVHPLRRYAAAHHLPEPTYHTSPQVQPEADHASRYDDALYGPADSDADHAAYGSQQHAGYHDDYSYQDDYADEVEERRPRRKGLVTVAAVVALAVIGTGAAFGYRTFVGKTRSGEPPIIKADAGPNKVVPPSADGAGKQIQDRMAAGNAAEQLVSREEQPVDVKDIAKSGPRVVFPPLNQNANPPSTASVAPGSKLAANGGSAAAVGGTEPRKIKTLMVRSDEATAAAAEPVAQRAPAPAPVPAPPATTRAAMPSSTPAPNANAPLSLAPQAAPSRVASVNPTQAETPAATGGYVVQVSAQRSEADARASFKALQHKFPSSFGSHTPLIKRADLGSRGVYYRAMVGPFGTSEQAVQFCGNLKAAGGQCVVQRN
ncbi:MAG: SPOR domain-containing protein [Rhizobiales bacterium]|nr:SPOR domain-containing protein [Hyphomicrobiales bacterium]